jgi:hypothetical protein
MLADQAELPSPNEQFSKDWQRKYLEAYGRQLLRQNENAQSVRVRRIAHWPLPLELAEQNRTLTDPEGYELIMEATQRRSDLGPEVGDQSQMWQGGPSQQMNPGYPTNPSYPMNTAGRWNGAPR